MQSPETILHIISDLDGYGLCRQLELLAERQQAAGQVVQVAALRGDRPVVERFRRRGIDVRVLDRRWTHDPFLTMRLAALLRRNHFDLLHAWGRDAQRYVNAVRPLVPATPQTTSLADQDLPIGVSLSKKTKLSRQQLLDELDLPADATLIAVAGPLVRTQQVDEAIWHFELVRTLDENTRLLIFGDGPDRHRLERFTRLTSEPTAVRFLGYRHDYRSLLQHVDLFWHTASADEATPLTIVEAMSAGVPVVANDTPNCRRAIDHSNNGYLVAENDRAVFARHTRQLMHDREHAQEMSEAAKHSAERYSIDAMLDAHATHYEHCCA